MRLKQPLGAAVVGLAIFLTGCIPNAAYRTEIGPCKQVGGKTPSACSVQPVESTGGREVPVAFIEFDDMGQAFLRGQIKAAENTIALQHPENGDVVTILFIHGWKNNASDDSGNVPGFRRFLQEFQAQLPKTKFVGVYFGWRGGTTNLEVVKEFTYWNRRDTATYIPGSNMSEALLRIAQATKGDDYCSNTSRLIVVGHSFGGLVLERTVTQYVTRRMIEKRVTCLTSSGKSPAEAAADQNKQQNDQIALFADLLVFVNEAAAATEAIQLLTMLNEHVDTANQRYPTILSMTSQGDTATKFILPVGQGASLFKKTLRSYGGEYDKDPFGIKNQKTYYLRSATHIPELQSHVVAANDPKNVIETAYKDRGYTCAAIPQDDQHTKDYYVVRIKDATNITPYWVMQLPVDIVPNHSDVFQLAFGQLLQAFVLRQAQEKDERPNPGNCYGPQQVAPPDMKNMRSTLVLKKR
jgi:pimeloyl-ACP methyl ester carboxylesterase